MAECILEVKDLTKRFRGRDKKGREDTEEQAAVDGVSFSIEKGECLGLIGESGSGKSTTAYMAAGLLKPDRGECLFHGRHMQMVFQDPMKAMNPRKKVIDSISEGLLYHRNGLSRAQIREKALEAMDMVQIDRSFAERYSRELSGGECQRATIARAILIRPELLICDEVTSALDVSVQAQIIRLLDSLKKRLRLSYLFISHDIALVSSICDRVAVMYRGKIVEIGRTKDVIADPQNEYTRCLIDSILTL
ncbi:ATP-binding cassette domain-containing protein [Lacrimispora sp. NSJ-141]|uniref:ATP-binding cassette domain-containing protein n=1 Tax=Lientehia hominis TaxID=2897778 RepID=A0AAP2RGJ6_9FIRM|nr:ATP-binding cassette domain-containing protein [Lientehia hominis]MCD2491834.1 ATP-binding cassette domain-containing protein [Lientehia hominis]